MLDYPAPNLTAIKCKINVLKLQRFPVSEGISYARLASKGRARIERSFD